MASSAEVEVCGVCGHSRDNHPFRHVFNADGKLVEPEPPKKAPAQGPGNPNLELVFHRLMIVLKSKNLISDDELQFIFTGQSSEEGS